ncbi:MAG: tetratricopeptide repeat protein [Candidatus Aminicenantes bacterium]|nr:tetratricopeptide repeat protein [Candidatus Aminicenantes bacterium]
MKSLRKEKKTLILSMLIMLFFPLQMLPCLILKIAHGDCVLAGNNEDIDNPLTKIWFEPPKKGKYGITYFGYSVNYPQGGMNDQGLFFDAVAGYKTDWRPSPKRLDYAGNLNRKVMEECATVEEAISVYNKYNKSSFSNARYLLADRTGASAIVGWIDGELKFIRDKGGFQAIGVNEDTAASMLRSIKEQKDAVRVDDVKAVLQACHVEGRYPTQYSNICDLKNNVVYMFLFHDYSTFVKFDANEEFKKGEHHYRLLPLFPDNVRARKADEKYRQHLLNQHQKVIENPKERASGHGWRELSLLGLELLDYQEHKEAIAVLKLTAERYPDDWRSHSNLAFSYMTAGEIELAVKSYRKVLELDPGNQNALKAIRELTQKKDAN